MQITNLLNYCSLSHRLNRAWAPNYAWGKQKRSKWTLEPVFFGALTRWGSSSVHSQSSKFR